ncbi:MAG: hypothetical protein PHY12_02100 [Eubacteriales bacterium]|nr:hypothetical protein [Eubacteriales bacterium]
MMYPFLTLEDETEIVHSEMLTDGRVKVYLEKPDENDGFHHATCYLPESEWTEITGFSEDEMTRYRKIIEEMKLIILDFSQKGGFRGASDIKD